MKESVLIFPTQLFRDHPSLAGDRQVFLIEEKRFFTDFRFHKKKLILHRASMKAYQDYLEKTGYQVEYFSFQEDWRSRVKGHRLFAANVYDRKLEGELPDVTFSGSPAFLGGEIKKSGRYVMGHFYKKQRKRLGILMRNGKPSGGRWSFDAENRKPLPKGHLPAAAEKTAEIMKIWGPAFPEHPEFRLHYF